MECNDRIDKKKPKEEHIYELNGMKIEGKDKGKDEGK